MNKQGDYVYFDNPNKVFGPFGSRAEAVAYAGKKGTIALLTGNEILLLKVRVVAPHKAR